MKDQIICYYVYKSKKDNFPRSSFVFLGENYYLPEDVEGYYDADVSTKEYVMQLVQEQLEKFGADTELVEIYEFDNYI